MFKEHSSREKKSSFIKRNLVAGTLALSSALGCSANIAQQKKSFPAPDNQTIKDTSQESDNYIAKRIEDVFLKHQMSDLVEVAHIDLKTGSSLKELQAKIKKIDQFLDSFTDIDKNIFRYNGVKIIIQEDRVRQGKTDPSLGSFYLDTRDPIFKINQAKKEFVKKQQEGIFRKEVLRISQKFKIPIHVESVFNQAGKTIDLRKLERALTNLDPQVLLELKSLNLIISIKQESDDKVFINGFRVIDGAKIGLELSFQDFQEDANSLKERIEYYSYNFKEQKDYIQTVLELENLAKKQKIQLSIIASSDLKSKDYIGKI